MAPRDPTHPQTPHEALENIITHKKHALIEDIQTPVRIRSLLKHIKNENNIAEIVAHIVFPETSSEVKNVYKAQSFLKGSILGHNVKDNDFSRLKSEIQRVAHLTEHTRLQILNILDDLRKK